MGISIHRSIRFALAGLMCMWTLAGCRATCPSGPGPSLIRKDPRYIPSEHGEILATGMAFDLRKGEIRYTLPEPAFVRIRIGINHGGALLHHILDWEMREAGPHVETWDKKDGGGRIDFGDRADYMLVLNCRPVKSRESLRRSPAVTVTFPEARETSAQGDPVVGGITALRVALDSKDSRWWTETKFEVALYIDYMFLMEDESGTNPFNYRLDTTQLSDGEHAMTVNVISYNGEVGTQTVKFWVKR